MSEAFVGQISVFAFNFPPVKWAACQGQTLTIAQHTLLFSLLGTLYGGNGTTTFGLPNLQGRVALGSGNAPDGNNYLAGDAGGASSVALAANQIPDHRHNFMASTNSGTTNAPAGNVLASPVGAGQRGTAPEGRIYTATDPSTAPKTVAGIATGGVDSTQPHANLQPFLALNYCICLDGIIPPRS
jgi:microcystin-dependent protein